MKRIAGLALLFIVACASSRATASFGEPVTLHAGQSAQFADGLTIAFNRVVSDSRCPVNVVCIQKGDVVVELAASLRGESQIVNLDFDHTPRATVYGHTVELRQVAPAPKAPLPATVDYTVTVVVQ